MRILIADDHALFRAGIRRLLDEAFEDAEIIEAGEVRAVLDACEGTGLDLILLDLAMPGADAASIVAEVVERAPNAFVVVVSGSERRSDVIDAMRSGAVGYIPKASTPAVMLGIVKLILSGGVYAPPDLLKVDDRSPAASASTGAEHLSERQREVLALIAAGKSNKEIARSLKLSLSTVKLHVAGVLHALGVENRTEAASAAIRQGLVSR